MITLLIIISVLLLVALGIETFYIYNNKKRAKSLDLVKELSKIKTQDDFIIDQEHDNLEITSYLSKVKEILNAYDKSRSKKISSKTKKTLLYESILVIPFVTKRITLDIPYNEIGTLVSSKNDRDIMEQLKEAYNKYSEDYPESFNDILFNVLLLINTK